MNKKITIISLLIILTTVGCKIRSAFDSITIETNDRSETTINIPEALKGKEIVVLNRTNCSNSPYNLENNDETKVTIRNNTFDYLKNEIKERNYFSLKSDFIQSDAECSTNIFPESLTNNEVKKHTENQKLLLTIEKISFNEEDDFRKEVESTYDKNDNLVNSRNVIIGKKNISVNAAIKLYDTTGFLMDSLIISESYTYEVKGDNQLNAKNLLRRGRNLGLVNIGKKLGFAIAEATSPYYLELTRYYFAYARYNSKFNIAQEIIEDEGDWVSASIVWSEIANSDDDATDRAKAYFNLGVYHEKNGEFDTAVKMLQQSALLNPEVGRKYFLDLNARYGGE